MQENQTIFIVEDSLFLSEMLHRVLTESGFTVVGGARYVEGSMDQIKVLKPNLVLLDLALPSQNGLSLVSEIQSLNIHTNIVVCSGLLDNKEVLKQSRQAGIKHFIKKPFKSHDLIKKLSSIQDQKLEIQKAS